MKPEKIAPGGHFPVRLPPKCDKQRTGTLTNKDLINAISVFGFKV